MERTLQILFRAERKGFGGKPNTEVRLTLESYEGKRYAAWGAYKPDATRAEKLVSIRGEELTGVIAALQQAQALWALGDEEFTGELTHAEYASSERCPIS